MNKNFFRIVACFVCFIMILGEVPAIAENIKELQKKAQKGNTQAQYELGMIYCDEKKYAEAFKLLLNAAKKGHAKAQHLVGSLYDLGWGVEKNKREAFNWYLKSANQGEADAQLVLGLMYDNGDNEAGIKENKTEALKWYQKAAKNGDQIAKELLENIAKDNEQEKLMSAFSYYSGDDGLPQDKAKAFEIFLEFAEKGDQHAQFMLALMYDNDYLRGFQVV